MHTNLTNIYKTFKIPQYRLCYDNVKHISNVLFWFERGLKDGGSACFHYVARRQPE
ncbi:hypothetical protein GT2_13_00280 [Parageobacillus thermoglucosidasius NBRC 107763]|nr:hypothetical protein GT2_13_00280 [Parageobacillus thermoglucosidasius NBRC 107763]